MEQVTIGDEIQWIDIWPEGQEVTRRGHLWSPAPALRGMRSWWVIPADLSGEPARRGAVRVATAAKRHRCGRALPIRAGVTRYFPREGRWIDPGEHYRETDPGSPFAVTHAPPRHVTMRRMDAGARNEFGNYVAFLDRVHDGEDLDCTVTIPVGHDRGVTKGGTA